MGLKNDAGYGLFTNVQANFSRPIRGHQFICDVVRTEDEARKENEALSDRILFKKRVNVIIKDKISDPVELHLEYAEAVNYVLNNLCPLNEESATLYAALILQVRYGDCSSNAEAITE